MIFRKIMSRVWKKGCRSANRLKQRGRRIRYNNQIDSLLKEIQQKQLPVMIFLDIVDWNIPLFQRPQHMAKCVAEQGYIYLFFTTNTYDDVKAYEEKNHNLYIINNVFKKRIIQELQVKKKFIQLYSTDMKTSIKDIIRYKQKGYKLIYEYIDEISAELYGNKIPEKALKKHNYILHEKAIFLVCTARKLYEEAVAIRGFKNLKLITNGVEYKHFNQVQPLTNSSKIKKTIGYFGAFANWFDYELIKYVATQCKEYEFLFIGWKYDESLTKSHIEDLENVKIVGPISYTQLPSYAADFDVSIIPFKVNEITESTSPIKLFEYMALGRPIVTTAMPECMLYDSVLIAHSPEEFILKLKKAIELSSDKIYLEKLNNDALENTWEAKAKDIIDLIGNRKEADK